MIGVVGSRAVVARHTLVLDGAEMSSRKRRSGARRSRRAASPLLFLLPVQAKAQHSDGFWVRGELS